MSYREAERRFGIPRSTFFNHISRTLADRPSPAPFIEIILNQISAYLLSHNIRLNFNNGRPSPIWLRCLRKRLPEIQLKGNEHDIMKGLKKLPTMETIEKWFNSVKNTCIAKNCDDLLNMNSRIFSMSEAIVKFQGCDFFIKKFSPFDNNDEDYLNVVLCGNGAEY